MRKIQFICLLLLLSVAATAQTVLSPGGRVSLTFRLAAGGVPTYQVNYKERPVILQSRLGLELAKDKHASKGI